MGSRWRHLLNDSIQTSDDTTLPIDLPNRGKLHALLIKVQCQSGATAGRGVSIFDALDDIQILGDGTEVLYSQIPEVTEKWYETLFGKPLDIVQDELASAVQEGVFPIYFGRELYDREMYLDLGRFDNIQLRLAYSPTISGTVGFITGTFTVDIMALITPDNEPLTYLGTLVTRRIKQFTSLVSGEDATTLFDNALYRNIGVYAYEAAIADNVDITRIRLDDVGEGVSLLDADWDDFIHLNRYLFGTDITHDFRLLIQDTNTIDTRLADIHRRSVSLLAAIEGVADMTLQRYFTAQAGDRLTVGAAIIDIVAGSEAVTLDTTDRDTMVSVSGKSPSYFGLIPYMYPDDPSGYLRTADFGQLDVILTQSAAGADVRIGVQELRQF